MVGRALVSRQPRAPVEIDAALGAIVHLFRERRRLKQVTIARKAKLSQAQFSKLETGEAIWTVRHLRMIARALEAQPSTLLYLAERRVRPRA
jgi:transcriptional regulator with XRE-family HTH domain